MIYYNVMIDNVDYTENIAQGLPLVQSIGDELDSSTLCLKGQNLVFKKFQSVAFTMGDTPLDGTSTQKKYFYFLLMDVREEPHYDYSLYTLILVEPTKILENIVVNGLSTTASFANLYTQVRYIITKLNAQLKDVSLSLDATVISKITLPSEEFKWAGEVTLREIFDDLFSSADLSVRVKTTSLTNNIRYITISFDNPNGRGKVIDISEPNELEKGCNTEYKANAINTLVNNASNFEAIYSEWQGLRGESVLSNTSEDGFIVNHKINDVYSFLCYCRYTKDYTISNPIPSGNIADTVTGNLDFTKYVYEKDEYNLLTVEEKKTALYYKRNTNKICGFNETYAQNFAWSNTVINNIIYDMENEGNGLRIYHDDKGDYTLDIEEIYEYMLAYYPMSNVLIYDKKSAQEPLLTGTSIINNQSNSNVDIKRFSNSIVAKNKHLGNDQFTFCKSYETVSFIPMINDYNGDYVVDKVEYAFFKQYVKVNAHFTKGYNNINEKTSLKREKRIYNIPLENYIERYVYKEINSLNSNETITDVAIKTNVMSKYVHCEVLAYNVGNDRYFLIKPYTNSCLGYYKTTYKSKKINQPVMYCDENGECTTISIALYKTRDACQNDYTFANYPFMKDVIEPYGYVSMNIYKDSFEMPVIVLIQRG